MTDHSQMKLGKRPRRHDARTLKLARYLKSGLPSAPPRVDYSCGITNFGMMLNDQIGCCTIAAAAHAVQVWTANAGTEITFPDPVILDYYRTWDGYNPADPSTDQGGVELDVLNDWRKQSFAGHGLDAYAALSAIPDSGFRILEVQTAIWLFGGVYIGLELPLSAQNQEVWDIEPSGDVAIGRLSDFKSPNHSITKSPDDPGSWGGHAVILVGYDTTDSESRIPNSGAVTTPAPSAPPLLNPEGSLVGPTPDSRFTTPDSYAPSTGFLTCITWGQLKKMSWPWFAKYCSEAYGLVSKDWLRATGLAPSGFDLATLEADLKFVTS
jgi:hypothetical protein